METSHWKKAWLFVRKNCLYIILFKTIVMLMVVLYVCENNLKIPVRRTAKINDKKIIRERTFDISKYQDQNIKHHNTSKSDGDKLLRERQTFCAMYSNAYKQLIWSNTPQDFDDWTYKKNRECPNFQIPANITNTTRMKYFLNCFGNKPKLVSYFTNRSDDIQFVKLNNTCLSSFTEQCCNDHRGIPNIIHYVWYFQRKMDFSMFLSMLSAIRYVRPCLILIHGEFLPLGKYWDYIVRIYPNFLHIQRPRPINISGKIVSFHEHSGDLLRMEAMIVLGGIYFDHDIIALRDLEPLRDYSMTLCNQSDGFLLNSFIMAKRNTTFLQLWMDGYRKDFRNDSYVYNSMFYNNYLALNRTDLIHIENGTLCSPSVLLNRTIMSKLTYDWSKLYGYHLHSRTIHFPWDETMINNFNTTIGAMARQIVYGNKELCANVEKFMVRSGFQQKAKKDVHHHEKKGPS